MRKGKRHFWSGFMVGSYVAHMLGCVVFLVWMLFAKPPLLYFLAFAAVACALIAWFSQQIYRQIEASAR